MKVPTYTSQVKRTTNVGAQRMGVQASPQAASAGSRAAAQFFDQVSRLGQTYMEAEFRARNKTQEMEARNGAQKELNEIIRVTDEISRTDPTKAESFYQDQTSRIGQKYSSLIENDELRGAFELNFASNLESQSVSVRKGIRNQVIQQGAAAFQERESDLSLRASKGDMIAFDELFGNEQLGTGGIYAEASQYGYLSPTQAADRKLSMKRDVVKQQVYQSIDNAGNVEELQMMLDDLDDNPPAELMPSTVMSIGDAIRSDIRSIEAARKEAVRVAKAIDKDLSDEKRASIEAVFDQAASVGEAQALLTNIISNQASMELLTNSDLRAIKTYGRSTVSRLRTEQTAAVTSLKGSIRDIKTVMSQGIDPGQDQIIAVAQAAANLGSAGAELQPDIAALAEVRDYAVGLRQATPKFMEQELVSQRAIAEEAEGQQQVTEVEKLKIAQQFQANMKTAISNDPIAWAAKTGVVDQLPPIIPSSFIQDEEGNVVQNPEFMSAVAKRRQISNLIAVKYDLTTKPIFTQAERSTFKDRLKNGDPTQRLDILQSIVRGFGADTQTALNEIADSDEVGVYGHIGGLILDGRNESAEDALRGITILEKGGPIMELTDATINLSFQQQVGTALEGQPEARGSLFNAAKAIYASRYGSQSYNPSNYAKAVQAAAGRTPDGKGGLDPVNGAVTVIPSNMTSDDLENAIELITVENLINPEISGQNVSRQLVNDFKQNSSRFKVHPAPGTGAYYIYRGEMGTDSFRWMKDTNGDVLLIDFKNFYDLVMQ